MYRMAVVPVRSGMAGDHSILSQSDERMLAGRPIRQSYGIGRILPTPMGWSQ